ncbi:MAG: hypothetical protein UR85_C0008G0012 [Candidatus Nomurabacteria bacterium GW2011_GWF2_35_66]|uniref:Uncharacterized protein n=1 Tax=Candidatus Nomurabacteria bacterium GW2011_GWE1_35_16 TaxID=1618761 RepID=A0A0G0EFY2_9BACT|nr:MAG: hypothetical protein UR55_C0011G0012 [Candidatus Nomurabacteria bacterium GW2011_GWF1_34_20]KKP62848.1 MAG: hypothetical protein UR57_C0010G0012 [Candidatus Nomurabacteria bacterium GW2011_GWE2_34_25]KKP66247.1 MAG: hypothetical protein UR64_C0010G0012 [Candidatus Nomurabacteria bacterium GW2011_GWE1_35_16]KKP83079.1 MAG: hypothetical protein UR85_C0008G0012 [Candidatus Nomurabacteria bacterium GW2011_GWF2_35_66]
MNEESKKTKNWDAMEPTVTDPEKVFTVEELRQIGVPEKEIKRLQMEDL